MITAVNLEKTSHSKAPDYVEIYGRMQDFIEVASLQPRGSTKR